MRWSKPIRFLSVTLLLMAVFLAGNVLGGNARIASSITCSVYPVTLSLGDGVTVFGEIAPAVIGAEVALTYTSPDGTTLVRNTITSLKSTYADFYKPDAVGSWTVIASWTGSDMFEGATSSPESFTVVGLPSGASKITCMTDYSSTVLGGQIGIYGAIVPAISASVIIEVSVDGESWSTLATITSTSNGNYSYTWTPNRAGAYSLRSRWPGDGGLGSATSNVVYVVVHSVEEPDFSISVSPSSQSVDVGQKTVFTLSLASLHGFDQLVALGISDLPTGTAASFNPPSLSGNASSSLTISTSTSTLPGTYNLVITGSFSGRIRETNVVLNVMGPSRCLIATATFGSELTSEVQLLRVFRDKLVLSTFAGRGFMSVFNRWYYSFSPNVAEFISEHPVARFVLRVLLYPLIGILHTVTQAHHLFSFGPELAIIVVGLVACSLIGVIYLLPPLLLPTIVRQQGDPIKLYDAAGGSKQRRK